MRKWLILSFFLSFNAFAQELPEHLEELLVKSQEYFEIYNDKSAAEIDDAKFDESEFMLFSHIDQVNGLNVIFSKTDIKNLKIKMVLSLSQIFDESQLEAIIRIGKSNSLNKKYAARFFEVALEYKTGILKEILIGQQLSPKYFNFR